MGFCPEFASSATSNAAFWRHLGVYESLTKVNHFIGEVRQAAIRASAKQFNHVL